jgi:predicted MFS family arabinose efflux permease
MTHLFRPYIYLAILVLTRTAMGFQFQSVASLSPFLIDELEITFAALGTLIGLFMLPGIFIAIPSGIMGRRLSDKTFAIIGLVGMVAGGAILGAASGFGEAVAGRLVSGTGAVILNVVLAKMVADWFDARDQIVAMAFLVTSWPLGIGLALVVEPMIAEAASWQMAMFAAAVLCAAALVMLWLFCRDPPADEDAKAAAASSLTRREFYLVSLVGLIWTLYNAGYIFVVSFTPSYLADSGASPTAAGIVTSLATWTLIVTVPLGGYLASRIGSDRTWMFWSFAVMAAAMFALPYTSAIAAVLVIGIAAGPAAGAIMAAAASVLQPQNRGIGMGVYFTWYYVGMTALPFAGGLVRDVTGDPAGIFIFGGAFMVLTAATLLVFSFAAPRQTPSGA